MGALYSRSAPLATSLVPTMLPMNAATSHTQPCTLPDAIPLKYAPMLQPYAMRAPYPRSSPPATAVAAERPEMRQAGANRPARPAAVIAPSISPMSITDVASATIGACSAARCAGDDHDGHDSTPTFAADNALAPHNANAPVMPHGRPAI